MQPVESLTPEVVILNPLGDKPKVHVSTQGFLSMAKTSNYVSKYSSSPFLFPLSFGVMLRTQANQMFLKKANILVVMVNVDYHLDSVWNHLGYKPMGTPMGVTKNRLASGHVRPVLVRVIEMGRCTLRKEHHRPGSCTGPGKGKVPS